MLEVALFPIPNVVAFPNTVVPLHVFEPRYRTLVHDCVADNRMVGVSHVVKTIHQPLKQKSLEDALSTNQATYKPRTVFSAGRCAIIETSVDGRIIATVTMTHRLALLEDIQTLPYRIVSCTPVEDMEDSVPEAESRALQESINNRLMEIAARDPNTLETLRDPEWTSLDPSTYSFRVFQLLQFDPDVMQLILEAQSVHARLEMTWDMLCRV